MLVLSPFKMHEVCILLRYPNKWFSIGKSWIQPLPYHPKLCNLDNPVHHIQVSCIVCSTDSIHRTLHAWIQCVCTMLFHRRILWWILRRICKQPYDLTTPVLQWMEFRSSCDLKFESKFSFHRNLPAHTVFSHIPMGLIKIPTLHAQLECRPVLGGFALDVKVL